MLTGRFFVAALVVPTLLVLGAAIPALAVLAGVYGVALLSMTLMDRYYAGSFSQFDVTRLHDEKLSLGVANRIVVRIVSRARREIPLIVQDEPPLLFVLDANGALLSAELPALAAVELVYHARPLRRGDFAFGNINLRWSSPLRLYIRQAVIPAARSVKVYPNLYEIRKYDLLVRRDQLAEIGLRNTRQRGEGTAYESLREYTPDDPYRAINWKATARRGKPISTDYEPERSQRVMLVIDVGRMMRSPIRVQETDGAVWDMAKVDFVINSALLFSYVATLKGDQVGLMVFADRVQQYLVPGAGRGQFHKLLEAMYALESQPVEADYARALTYLAVQHKKRSLVVLFTDLSGLRASEMLLTHVPRLAPRHLPMVVTIRDPALNQEAGQVPVDSESTYRRAVAEQLLDERRLLLENLQRQGVLTLDVDAKELTMSVVNRYLQLKARSLM